MLHVHCQWSQLQLPKQSTATRLPAYHACTMYTWQTRYGIRPYLIDLFYPAINAVERPFVGDVIHQEDSLECHSAVSQ